ncbi:type I-E CRISPR-associated protein Cas6/Cse3/CasE [Kitasatospora sp. NPDC002040]|uniref:type I-E CRISPR-associated protein Cas6/Cse3/CasE n=1 Tax=Kitasatospora sp. NPDC002040 TaxID=3154661 RepID=UPI00332F6470
MTYLSRIRINPLRAESRKLITNPRALHGAVTAGIPDLSPTERILWRLDSDNPRRPVLLVLTPTKPDWTHVVEQAGWPDAEGEHYAIRDYSPLLARLTVGEEFAFRLTASPVQNTSTPDKAPQVVKTAEELHRRSYRLPHRTAPHQLAWFLQRTARWGFDIPLVRGGAPVPSRESATSDASSTSEPAKSVAAESEAPRAVRIADRNRHTFTKPGTRSNVTLTTATFEGHLRITDPNLLKTALLGGIGPSKAYGCGLLTLAPPTRTAR